MAALDTRSRDILLILLNSEVPISSSEIAMRLGTSPRVINYSLRGVEIWLKQRGQSLIRKSGIGNFLDIPASKKKSLIKEVEKISGYDLILNPKERERFLTLSLLTGNQPLLVKSIAPKLGVSRPTVFNDMDAVEAWLVDHGLKLIRRPGYGFEIDGSELDIRKGIVSVVLDTIGQMSLLALYQGKSNPVLTSDEWERGLQNTPDFDLNVLEFEACSGLVKQAEEMSHFSFTDSSHLAMVLFFCVLIDRGKKGHVLNDFPIPGRDFLETREYELALTLTNILNEKYELKLGNAETANMAAHIMGIKGRQSLSTTAIDTNTMFKDEEIEQLIRAMILEASKMLHPILNIDQQLRQGLLFHIKPVMNRLYFGLRIRNFLLDEIKSQYPYIFMVAEKTSKVLESRIGRRVPESEIGYLAMHFGAAMERLRSFSTPHMKVLVVCGGGCATAWMLVSRMHAEFPELDVVDVRSAMDLAVKEDSELNIDLIITTIPLEITSVPVVLVNPLLGDGDKLKIRETLGLESLKSGAGERMEFEKGRSLASLLTEETIQLKVTVKNWEQAVSSSCLPLLQNGAIEERYVGAIKDLLKQHGPYMVISPGVVLLHAMTGFGVKKVCMSLTTFNSPVKFGHQFNDPVSLAIVFGATDNHSHLKALIQLSKLLGDQGLMNDLKSASSKEELVSLLYKAVQAVH